MTGSISVRKHTRRRTGRSAEIARRLGFPDTVTVVGFERRRPAGDGLHMAEGPGKFEGELLVTEMLWEASLDWGFNDEFGSVQDFGFYGRMDFDKDITKDLEGAVRQLTPEERAFLKKQAGVIMTEDSNGFVGARYYESRQRLDRAWSTLQGAFEELSGSGE